MMKRCRSCASTGLRDAFRALDRSYDGFVSRADFLEAMRQSFLGDDCSDKDVDKVARHFDLDRDGEISYAEFASILERSMVCHEERGERVQRVDLLLQRFRQRIDLRHSSNQQAFRALDKNRDASLSREEMLAGLHSFDIAISPEDLGALWRLFCHQSARGVRLADFCRVLAGGPPFGEHLRRQMFQHRPPSMC
mmetsp:Transcript_109161/g.348453  ORF Transcript_109161/g.348453 Transcript_109161/m.348453 type:complete len:194 (+) Transcript_109161:98-679(+)